jgi:hypothetical protein
MRKLFVALSLALATAGFLTLGPATPPASAQAAVSVSLFYNELAPHGRWFRHPRWGWAWFPVAVGADWRPYSHGRWVWTEEHGWYWESEEVFGWATYHYGRWAYDEQYGWIWIPGGTWGPAWVAFRYSDDHVGWAPLPPETLDTSYDWDPGYTELSASYYQPRWVFIPRRHFLAHRVYAYAVPPARNYIFIRSTVNVTRYERGRRGIVNRSIEPRRLEAALGRRITPVRLNLVSEPRRVGPDRRGTSINVFRADVRVNRDLAPPEAARARPQDRPRYAIRRDTVAPSERRDRGAAPEPTPGPGIVTPRPPTPGTPAPGTRAPDAPRVVTPDDRRDLRRERDNRRATPGTPPAVKPGEPPPRPSFVQPATPRTFPDERRRGDERQAAPPLPNRAAPPTLTQPPAPPSAPGDIRRGRDERSAPPPRTFTRPETPRPPSYAAPPAPRPPAATAPQPRHASPPPSVARPPSAPPPTAQPPRVAPSAPPQPRPQPQQSPPAQKQAPPQKKEEDRKGPAR